MYKLIQNDFKSLSSVISGKKTILCLVRDNYESKQGVTSIIIKKMFVGTYQLLRRINMTPTILFACCIFEFFHKNKQRKVPDFRWTIKTPKSN